MSHSQSSETLLLPASPDNIERAAALLRAGEIVALPTETVYGLGGDATNPQAVAAIYAAKERPSFNPLIAHYPDMASASLHGDFNPAALKLAQAFWPGPLTLVVPRKSGCPVSDLASAGLDSIAIRVPAHPVARALLAAAGRPIAAPSANRSGRISPTTAAHVMGDLAGRIAAIVDGGPTQVGLESTIVACIDDEVRLLRPGGTPREAIEAVLGRPLVAHEPAEAHVDASDAPLAPGMLTSHYAPRAGVRLHAMRIEPGEAALLFGPTAPEGLGHAVAALNLSENGDLGEAAAHLFQYLRQLDASGAASIAVQPVPEIGLGEAINDRLRRAAAPRP